MNGLPNLKTCSMELVNELVSWFIWQCPCMTASKGRMNGESCRTGNDREVIQKISIGLVSFPAGIRPGTFGIYPDGGRDFCVFQTVQTSSGVHPVSLMYRGSCPAGQQPGREVDHSRSSRAEIKSKQSYTSTPSIGLSSIWWTRTFLYLLLSEYKCNITDWATRHGWYVQWSSRLHDSFSTVYLNVILLHPRYGRSLCDFSNQYCACIS